VCGLPVLYAKANGDKKKSGKKDKGV
jgi:hypothetical protein